MREAIFKAYIKNIIEKLTEQHCVLNEIKKELRAANKRPELQPTENYIPLSQSKSSKDKID